jgi:hypothetical protein
MTTRKLWTAIALLVGLLVGTNWPQATYTPAGGGLTLLEVRTASNSASLDFTTGITSAFDQYVLEINSFVPAADSSLLVRFSSNNGSSWDTGSNYNWTAWCTANGAFPSGHVEGTSQTSLNVWQTIESTSSAGVSATLRIHNPLNASVSKLLRFDGVAMQDTGDLYRFEGGGKYASASVINGIQLKAGSGNIASGVARLYGVAK